MTWRMKIGIDKDTGFDVNPVVGSLLKLDEWSHSERLISGDDWDRCEFRLPSCGGDLAVNIEITGRTLQSPFGGSDSWVRVKITFVADDGWDWVENRPAQDSHTRGWMLVTKAEKVFPKAVWER